MIAPLFDCQTCDTPCFDFEETGVCLKEAAVLAKGPINECLMFDVPNYNPEHNQKTFHS